MIIYTILNLATGRMYVGQTSGTLQARKCAHLRKLRQDAHANNYLQKSFNKHGADIFEFEILEHCSTASDCNEVEAFFINYLRFLGASLYNLASGGASSRHSAETRAKMSLTRKGNFPEYLKQKLRKIQTGRIVSAVTREKLRLSGIKNPPGPACIEAVKKARTGVPLSAEHRAKLAEVGRRNGVDKRCLLAAIAHNTGRKRLPSTIEKMRQAALGRKHSAQTRAKISSLLTDRSVSVETRRRISDSNLGKKVSWESRSKMSEAWQRRRNIKFALLHLDLVVECNQRIAA